MTDKNASEDMALKILGQANDSTKVKAMMLQDELDHIGGEPSDVTIVSTRDTTPNPLQKGDHPEPGPPYFAVIVLDGEVPAFDKRNSSVSGASQATVRPVKTVASSETAIASASHTSGSTAVGAVVNNISGGRPGLNTKSGETARASSSTSDASVRHSVSEHTVAIGTIGPLGPEDLNRSNRYLPDLPSGSHSAILRVTASTSSHAHADSDVTNANHDKPPLLQVLIIGLPPLGLWVGATVAQLGFGKPELGKYLVDTAIVYTGFGIPIVGLLLHRKIRKNKKNTRPVFLLQEGNVV